MFCSKCGKKGTNKYFKNQPDSCGFEWGYKCQNCGQEGLSSADEPPKEEKGFVWVRAKGGGKYQGVKVKEDIVKKIGLNKLNDQNFHFLSLIDLWV